MIVLALMMEAASLKVEDVEEAGRASLGTVWWRLSGLLARDVAVSAAEGFSRVEERPWRATRGGVAMGERGKGRMSAFLSDGLRASWKERD
jgi:membrane-bound ClpP family serine protease